MSDDQTQEQPAEAPAEPKRPSKMVLIGALAGTLIGGTAGGMLLIGPMVTGGGAAAATDSTAEHAATGDDHGGGAPKGVGAVHTIDNMVLNPAMSNGSRFLLVATAVELSDAAIVDELKARDAEARDILINVMGARTVEQLTDLAQRDSLRAEIAGALNAMLKKPKGVRRVYFSQFVVQ
jgi:flagellar FliL protein